MILESFDDKKYVEDDKLWGMVRRANNLTTGDYSSWDDNVLTLVPLLKRILARAKEVRDWRAYFYVMAKTFWYVTRDGISDIRYAFQLSEMFHQAHREHLAEETTRFGREFYVDTAVRILAFYMNYPQINDEKIEQMLGIFLESDEKYGTDWNRGSYGLLMKVALLQRDQEFAGTIKKKLESADYGSWCYVCFYVRPMLKYYVYLDDYDMVCELIYSVSRREIPKKYRWCYNMCEQANEESLVQEALAYCLNYGKCEMFHKIFETWRESYAHPIEGEIITYDALFHVLAKDLSRLDEEIRVAQDDERNWREKRATPLDAMHWFLCWHFYFRLLQKQGIERVKISLGEESAAAESQERKEECGGASVEEGRSLGCLEAAEYFEKLADEIGEKMADARKSFHYKELKMFYEKCLMAE